MHITLSRRGLLVGAAVAAGGVLTGCTPAQHQTNSPTATGYPKTIAHALGKTTLSAPPIRIAALDQSYVDATLLLGGKLVAYTLYRRDDEVTPAYLGDVASLTTEAANVGSLSEPDIEKILAAKPDLIISAKVRQGAMYAQLSKVAPTIMSESTGPTWKQNIQLLGDAMGKRDLADSKINEYKELAKQTGSKILAKHPSATYSLVRFASDATARLYSSKSFIGEIMSDMGIPRPSGQPDTQDHIFTPLAAENVLQADAQIIFETVVRSSESKGENMRSNYHSNPLWGRLKGTVVEVEDKVFVSSVSIQGATQVISEVGKAFGV